MPYIPPHLRQGYIPSPPATAEMLGLPMNKGQSIKPNMLPMERPNMVMRPFVIPSRYKNTIRLHSKRKSHRRRSHHRRSHHRRSHHRRTPKSRHRHRKHRTLRSTKKTTH
jgi:hypothetical protein